MKTIGLIGGFGPEATADYYKRITHFFHAHHDGLSTPDIIIYSADLATLFRLVSEQRLEELVAWLLQKLKALAAAGAEFAAISANTPHVVFDALAAQSPLPLISIVDSTLAEARRKSFKRVGLLGTRFTMQANFFARSIHCEGISVITPSPDEQDFIHSKLECEIERGIFVDSTKHQLLAIIERMAVENQIQAVILGCTELPLVIAEGDTTVPLLNTAEIHVRAICDACLA